MAYLKVQTSNSTYSFLVTNAAPAKPYLPIISGAATSYLPLVTKTSTHAGMKLQVVSGTSSYRNMFQDNKSSGTTWNTTSNATNSKLSSTTALTKATTTGTKYATGTSTTGTKYATGTSTTLTKYATGTSTTGTKYATGTSTTGTKYATGTSTTGTKYASKTTTTGTKYATGTSTTQTVYKTTNTTVQFNTNSFVAITQKAYNAAYPVQLPCMLEFPDYNGRRRHYALLYSITYATHSKYGTYSSSIYYWGYSGMESSLFGATPMINSGHDVVNKKKAYLNVGYDGGIIRLSAGGYMVTGQIGGTAKVTLTNGATVSTSSWTGNTTATQTRWYKDGLRVNRNSSYSTCSFNVGSFVTNTTKTYASFISNSGGQYVTTWSFFTSTLYTNFTVVDYTATHKSPEYTSTSNITFIVNTNSGTAVERATITCYASGELYTHDVCTSTATTSTSNRVTTTGTSYNTKTVTSTPITYQTTTRTTTPLTYLTTTKTSTPITYNTKTVTSTPITYNTKTVTSTPITYSTKTVTSTPITYNTKTVTSTPITYNTTNATTGYSGKVSSGSSWTVWG